MNNIRSLSGQKIRVRHRCLGCNIPLCVRQRDCFYKYHLAIFNQSISWGFGYFWTRCPRLNVKEQSYYQLRMLQTLYRLLRKIIVLFHHSLLSRRLIKSSKLVMDPFLFFPDLVPKIYINPRLMTTKDDALRILSIQGHTIIDTEEKRLKPCVVCAERNVRSHRGHCIRIRHQCSKCRVALCIGYRDCFTAHHQSLLDPDCKSDIIWNVEVVINTKQIEYLDSSFFFIWAVTYFSFFFTRIEMFLLSIFSDMQYLGESTRCSKDNRAYCLQALSLYGHRIVDTQGQRLRACVVCASRNTRSRFGLKVRIRHQCSKCGVALCVGKRNCFSIYHDSLLQ